MAAPLNDYLGLRAGFSLLKFNYNYDYDGTYEGPLPANARVGNEDTDRYYTVPLKAKANMANGMVLLDYFPFRRSVFHVTAGLLFGTSSILRQTNGLRWEILSSSRERTDVWKLL